MVLFLICFVSLSFYRVGVALKGGDGLAGFNFPQPQGHVIRATGDGLAVWTVGHAEDLKQAKHVSEETFYLISLSRLSAPAEKGLSFLFIDASLGPP